jgi:hypothetical protein
VNTLRIDGVTWPSAVDVEAILPVDAVCDLGVGDDDLILPVASFWRVPI